jgi:hypothetical protein
MRLLRRRSDPRLASARTAHATGDFVTARRLAAEVVADGGASRETCAASRSWSTSSVTTGPRKPSCTRS